MPALTVRASPVPPRCAQAPANPYAPPPDLRPAAEAPELGPVQGPAPRPAGQWQGHGGAPAQQHQQPPMGPPPRRGAQANGMAPPPPRVPAGGSRAR